MEFANQIAFVATEPLSNLKPEQIGRADAAQLKQKKPFSMLLETLSKGSTGESVDLKPTLPDKTTDPASIREESNVVNFLSLTVQPNFFVVPSLAQPEDLMQQINSGLSAMKQGCDQVLGAGMNNPNQPLASQPRPAETVISGQQSTAIINTSTSVTAFDQVRDINRIPNLVSCTNVPEQFGIIIADTQVSFLRQTDDIPTMIPRAVDIANEIADIKSFSRKQSAAGASACDASDSVLTANTLAGTDQLTVDTHTIDVINANSNGKQTDVPLIDQLVSETFKPNIDNRYAVTIQKSADVQNELSTAASSKLGMASADDDEKSIGSRQILFADAVGQQVKQTDFTGIKPENGKIVQQQPDQYQIKDQIVEHARLYLRPNNSEMVIKLRPEHLGDVTLKVAVDNGIITASFHTDQPEVRSIIEASLVQLKQELSNQGLKVDHVGVYGGLQQFFANDQREQRQQFIARGNKKIIHDVKVAEEDVSLASTLALSGIDYRI